MSTPHKYERGDRVRYFRDGGSQLATVLGITPSGRVSLLVDALCDGCEPYRCAVKPTSITWIPEETA